MKSTHVIGWASGDPGTLNDISFSRLGAGRVALGTGLGGNTGGTFVAERIGLGTSTPYAQLSIVATSTNGLGSPTTLFAIASTSQGTATSTLFVVNNVGNVGIGTANPLSRLDIRGTNSSVVGIWETDGGNLALDLRADTGGGAINLLNAGSTVTRFSRDGVSYINNGNNFGIGTTSPWAQLSINPNGITGPAFVVGSSTATNFIVTNGGNVGIGTTTPMGLFTVTGSTFPIARFDRSTTGTNNLVAANSLNAVSSNDMVDGFGGAMVFGIQDTAGVLNEIGDFGALRSGADNSGALFFRTALSGTRTERMRIDQNGNVGIGSTSPSEELSVLGTIASVAKSTSDNTWFQGYNSAGNLVGRLREGSGVGGGGAVFEGYRNGASGSSFQFAGGRATDNVGDVVNYFNGFSATSMTGAQSTLTNAAIATFNNNSSELIRFTANGRIGVGTTSPLANLSVHANNGSTNTTLFAIGSSTASATTTVFSVDNTGLVSASSRIVSLSGFYTNASQQASLTDSGLSLNNNRDVVFGGTGNGSITWATDTTIKRIAAGVVGVSTGTIGSSNISGTLAAGYIGLGTSTPYAQLAIVATSTNGVGAPTTLFAIASTTAGTATSTLLSVSNTGVLTIGTINQSGLMQFNRGSDGLPRGTVGFASLTDGSLFQIQNTTGGGTLALGVNSGAGVLSNLLTLRTGNPGVDIGTTSGQTMLTVTPMSNSDSLQIYRNAVGTGDSATLGFRVSSAVSAINSAYIQGYRTNSPSSGDIALLFGNQKSGVISESMRIDSTGNVGIGSTTPWAQLAINPVGVSGPVFAIGSSTATRFVVTNGGTVAIGGPTSTNFVTEFGSRTFANYTDSTYTNGYAFVLGRGVDAIDNSAPNFYFTRNNGSGAAIANGNYIGRLSALPWDGDEGVFSAAINFRVNGTVADNSIPTDITFETGAQNSDIAERVRITSGGLLGIGSTTPWRTLSVSGTVAMPALVNDSTGYYACVNTTTGQLSTSTSACGASSEQFKKNIEDISYGLNSVMMLRAVSFDYKDNYIQDGPRQLGFIAEEVNLVIPELVARDALGNIKGLDYPKFTSVLAKAIQELNIDLQSLASTSPLEAQEGSFASRFFANVVAWFSDTANGIGDFVANRVRTTELCVGDENGETCLTRAQLDALLAGAGAAQAEEPEEEGGGSEEPPTEEPPVEEPPAEEPPAEESPAEEPPAEEPPAEDGGEI